MALASSGTKPASIVLGTQLDRHGGNLLVTAPNQITAASGKPSESGTVILGIKSYRWCKTLRDVWRVHYARDDDDLPRWRAGSELPPVGERLQSPYDTEAHYSTKRQMEWSGYKVHLTETCDEDAVHLITHVTTCPAMQQDMTSTAGIHDCLAAKDLLSAEHFVDSAYVDAGLLVSSQQDHGISLEGPARGMANQFGRGPGFEQRDFAIDWDRERVTCPRGKTSVTWRTGRDEAGASRIHANFSRTDCGACDVRALCTPSKDKRRSIYLHPRPEYEALNAARARIEGYYNRQRIHSAIGYLTPEQAERIAS